MSLNLSLTKSIREVQNASEKCTREFIKVCKRYDLTPAGAEGERQKLYKDVIETEKTARLRVSELIDQKIAELDAAEIRDAEKRSADTDYMNRLQMKINMIKSVDIQQMNDATLAAMFSEFENDPFAIELIRAAIPGGRSVKIEPANSCGARQAHLLDVKKAVLRAIGKAGAYISSHDLENGVIPFKSEVDALAAYITAQNEDFSKNDSEVWAKIIKGNPTMEVDAGVWLMRFSN